MDETTVSYYDSLADVINEKYPQGYQIALIKNEDYGYLGLGSKIINIWQIWVN